MKRALVTLLDDNFLIGFEGFYKSFIYHNKWFINSEIDLIILDNGLSEESKDKIKEYNENVIFRPINYDKYSRVDMSRTHDKLKATYYKLDIFGIRGYNRLIFIDSDVTIIGDIKELFECQCNIGACQTYGARHDKLNNSINSGVLVINQILLTDKVYDEIVGVATRGFSMPDQKAINVYFGNRIQHVNKIYNVEKRMRDTGKYKNIWNKKRILHWVADKPWMELKDHQNDIERSFQDIYPEWHKYYNMDWSDIIDSMP